MDPQGDGHLKVSAAARELVEALRATPVIQAYRQAEKLFHEDPEVRRLRANVERAIEAFQRSQEKGTLTQSQIDEARNLQARLQNHPVVKEFLAARDAAGEFLQGVNRSITEILGVDLGATVGPRRGTC